MVFDSFYFVFVLVRNYPSLDPLRPVTSQSQNQSEAVDHSVPESGQGSRPGNRSDSGPGTGRKDDKAEQAQKTGHQESTQGLDC